MINDLLGKLVADKYRVESLIREAEDGDFFLGRQEILDRPVTMKILSPALAVDARWVTRFIAQSRAASTLIHPNVLSLTDFGTDARGISYAIFEPTPGKTLRDTIAAGAPFDEQRAINVGRQIAGALAAAGTMGLLHSHLAPINISVEGTGSAESVRVFGFGGDPLTTGRDAEPQYLAPEQCGAYPTADGRSDVYAIGVILFEMLSGVVPFDGATAGDVMAKQSTEPPPPLSAFRRDIHPEIEPIVLTAMAAEPDRRYQSVAALAEDLELLAGRLGVTGSAEKADAAAAGTSKNNLWRTAFVALAGITLLGAALIYAMTVRQTDPTTQLQADADSFPVQPIGPATGAQEESLVSLPALTVDELAMATTAMILPTDSLPGGDGYNPWASGTTPPPGAPLQQAIPPGGQMYTVDPNGSQFMPPEGTVILVPLPVNTNTAARPETNPKPSTANANSAIPQIGPTPKPLATPPRVTRPAGDQPGRTRPAPPANQPPRSDNPSELSN